MFSFMRCGRYLQDTLAVNACRHMRRLLATQGSAVTPSSEDRTEAQPKYLHGKLVIEEVDDPHKIEHLLISITGYDAAVLDSFAKFVQNAAKMTNVDVTKSFKLPAAHESFNVRKANSSLRKDQIVYRLKKHQRIVQVSDVTEDKCDVFVDYVQEKLPSGVQVQFELKRWEELVAPNHPSLQKVEKTMSRYQK